MESPRDDGRAPASARRLRPVRFDERISKNPIRDGWSVRIYVATAAVWLEGEPMVEDRLLLEDAGAPMANAPTLHGPTAQAHTGRNHAEQGIGVGSPKSLSTMSTRLLFARVRPL
jgi:hypothetical protein